MPGHLLLVVPLSFFPGGDASPGLLKTATRKQLPTPYGPLGLLCCRRLISLLVSCLVAL